jgi:hypothetical protein
MRGGGRLSFPRITIVKTKNKKRVLDKANMYRAIIRLPLPPPDIYSFFDPKIYFLIVYTEHHVNIFI